MYYEIFDYLSQMDLLYFKSTCQYHYQLVNSYVSRKIGTIEDYALNRNKYFANNSVMHICKYMKNIDKTLYSLLYYKYIALFNCIVWKYDVQDFEGVLKIACEQGDKMIFDYCWYINEYRPNIDALLILACKGGDINIVSFLLNRSACYYDAALTKACHYGYRDICALLIKRGAKECFNDDVMHYHNVRL